MSHRIAQSRRHFARAAAMLALAAPLALSGCGKTIGDAERNGVDQAIANQADNDANPSTSALSAVTQTLDAAEGASPAVAGAARIQAACPSSSSGCSGNQRSVLFSGCQMGALVATGTLNLAFDSNATCNSSLAGVPTSGSLIRTFTNFNMVDGGRATTRLITDSTLNYKNESIGGGTLVNYGAGQRTVQILGMTRIKIHPNNRQIYHHSIRSQGVIQSQGSRATRDRIVSSGSVMVNHNLSRTDTVVRFDNLRWENETCCHPTAGSINSEVTDDAGTATATIVIEFSRAGGPLLACGQAEMTLTRTGQAPQQSIISMPSCE